MERNVAGANLEVLKLNLSEPVGQRGVDVEYFTGCIGAQPKHNTHHMKDTPRRPRLRNISATGIEDWKIHITFARYTREHLWWAIGVKAVDGVEDATHHLVGFLHQPIAFEAGGNNAVVLRPDRTHLIIVWVVGRILARKRADTPAAPHILV